MTKVVHKYHLKDVPEQVLELPKDAKILCAQTQHNNQTDEDVMCLWVCETIQDVPKEKRTILIKGTGDPSVPDDAVYINTVQTQGGQYVFHVFEKPRVERGYHAARS